MHFLTYPVLSIAVPAFVAFLTAWLMIKFGPARKEVSDLRSLVQEIVDQREKERSAQGVRFDVTVSDEKDHGTKVVITCPSRFRLIDLGLADYAGNVQRTYPGREVEATCHEFRIPKADAQAVYFGAGKQKTGRIEYTVQVDGIRSVRTKGVTFAEGSYHLPGDNTTYMYVFING
jgi:hypothetical protein